MLSDSLNRLLTVLGVVFIVAVVVNLKPLPKSIAAPLDQWFVETVVKQDKPTLVKFGAPWCGPCRYLDSELDTLESQLGDKIKVVRIDVDQRQDLARHYGVSGIPHIFLMSRGEILADQVGALDSASLAGWVKSHLPKK